MNERQREVRFEKDKLTFKKNNDLDVETSVPKTDQTGE